MIQKSLKKGLMSIDLKDIVCVRFCLCFKQKWQYVNRDVSDNHEMTQSVTKVIIDLNK